MPQISLCEVTLGFRGPTLLDGVTCHIEPGERIGLLGRNGSGKTSLLRILAGQLTPDTGEIRLAPGTRVAFLPQDVPRDLAGTVAEVVAEGLRDLPEDESEGWQRDRALKAILREMQLDPDAPVGLMSSGWKRRVLLARALVSRPEVLLLDEPTNHLEISAIDWLEDFLSLWPGTLLFVTHDRVFLRKLARRILEIDRGRIFDGACDYDTFLARKEAALAAEEKQQALFDKRLAAEEAWIRQGIKARRTRNEGRVRALEEMRRKRQTRREATGTAKLEIVEGARSGMLIAEVDKVSFAFGNRAILRDFSTAIMRGDKVGIIGPNGAGKSTLLRILLGQLPPQAGRVRLGTNLQIAYFDQLREQLDEDATVEQNVGGGSDRLLIGDKPRHVLGYLQDFLFSPDRARTAVRFLSGGERNRVLLARLFAKPANVIVLDEPTNDLDIETLELLEDRLVEFAGTVLLVSHDRAFLNNVVTSTLVFEAAGVKEYVGGYDDWLRQRPSARATEVSPGARAATAGRTDENATERQESPGRRKLSYKQAKELEGLPAVIERLESQRAALHEKMAQPAFYQQDGQRIAAENGRLAQLEAEIAAAYARWETLES